MKVLSRLVERIKPREYRDPFGTYHRSITWCMDCDCWDHLAEDRKREIIGWAKQNLWKDRLAYSVLKAVHDGDISV